MQVGDVVIPIPPTVLACGSGRYSHAIVASLNPFVLVSEEGDMLWSKTIEPDGVRALCQVHPDIQRVVAQRLQQHNRDSEQPTHEPDPFAGWPGEQ